MQMAKSTVKIKNWLIRRLKRESWRYWSQLTPMKRRSWSILHNPKLRRIYRNVHHRVFGSQFVMLRTIFGASQIAFPRLFYAWSSGWNSNVEDIWIAQLFSGKNYSKTLVEILKSYQNLFKFTIADNPIPWLWTFNCTRTLIHLCFVFFSFTYFNFFHWKVH